MDVTESARKRGIFLLSQDLLTLIHSFLNPIDIIMFSQMNKQFHNCAVIRKEIIEKFKCNLRGLLQCLGYAALDSVLQQGNGVLSGSCVLQAILGERWKCDIDLYSTFDGRYELTDKLAELGYFQFFTSSDTSDYVFNPLFGPTNFQGSKLSSVSEWGSIRPATGFSGSPRPTGMLQMIVLNETVLTAEEAIVDFDWDIVQNTWDGKTLHITAPTALATKVANAVGNGYELLIKNFETGSYSTAENSNAEEMCYAWKRMLKRMHKYSCRGFKIMVGTDEWTKEKLSKVIVEYCPMFSHEFGIES